MTRPARDNLDVDARFLLANERTLLAWVRTALTLMAVGVGVLQFGSDVDGGRLVAAVLVALAGAAGVLGTVRYTRADDAIRAGRLPRGGRSPTVLSWAVVVVALFLLAATALDFGW